MSQENYEQLIREWAQLTSATDVEALLQRGRVKVRDTIIDLVYHDDEEEEPLVLRFCCSKAVLVELSS